MLAAEDRVVLLQHGGLDSLTGKTGLAMLRHRFGPIVAVIDPVHAGGSLEGISGIRRDVPIVASLEEALPFVPEVAVVGLAPSGGRLPDPVRRDALAALRSGLSLASGLHTRLGQDPELCSARQPGRWIWDLRCEPEHLRVGQARAAALSCQRLLALGTDMAVGKMSACLALVEAAGRRHLPCRFVGTGQAGILIAGGGVPLDAVRVDYAAGAVEAAVLEAAEALPADGLVLVEGQGSLCHPGSTATLPLLRGSQPTDLLLVHRADQTSIERLPQIPLPALQELVNLSEALAALGRPRAVGAPPRVRAVALNTSRLGEQDARSAVASVSDQLGLPCTDPIRWGGERLLDAVLNSCGE
ncbi:P-loop containing nucleoside triphosphate hydrolase (DUF1611) [Synechococcus sp. A15-127]|jgi:uncharacterized NAD-dependent epimerase/dehydratase family protein|uniref:DUF1611 domain-containing protein n=1 Tax=Synechococcus sp. A15-127 TaxID=1050624 RepID=UPI001644ECB0|nr:DUF1611 domain-containing protein [Synechococcus sp. A15-127]QNI94012.1 P-loop containing nucleoside triphosphate hydrolase (DUF1611) [Synechococcus sp. A15-127]